MISLSNFGSTRHPESEKMRRAVEIVRERAPHLVVDGEINPDAAWYYKETKQAADEIRGRIAFWGGVQIT